MYEFFLILHNLLRWLVLVSALWALLVSLRGLQTKRYQPSDRTAGQVFVVAMDTMLLLGLILMFISPVVRATYTNLEVAMSQRELRFFGFEHVALMIIAVVLAHIGSTRVKRATEDGNKHRQALLWYGASLLLVLLAIPWWRPLLRI